MLRPSGKGFQNLQLISENKFISEHGSQAETYCHGFQLHVIYEYLIAHFCVCVVPVYVDNTNVFSEVFLISVLLRRCVTEPKLYADNISVNILLLISTSKDSDCDILG